MLEFTAHTQPATQTANFDIFARKLREISCKAFHRKTYFNQYCEIFYNTLFKTKKTYFHFQLNLERMEFTLYVNFGRSKSHLTLKLMFRATEQQQIPKCFV